MRKAGSTVYVCHGQSGNQCVLETVRKVRLTRVPALQIIVGREKIRSTLAYFRGVPNPTSFSGIRETLCPIFENVPFALEFIVDFSFVIVKNLLKQTFARKLFAHNI